VIGTTDAFHALKTDTQVASRFEPLFLPRWTEADAFRSFVMAYGRLLPLRKPSAFGEPAMIRTLLQLSGGITGRVTSLLGRAAEVAITDSSEQIDVAALERINERLRVAAA
jgi:Bacterial TniB protein